MIYGIAVNDLPNHKTQIVEYILDENGKNKRKVVWQCPFYTKWFNMLSRCYKKSELERHPTYQGVTVCDEWLIFSNFKAWMEQQDYEGKQLDKDILFKNNNLYCPEKCCFITQNLNKFLLEKTKDRDLPIGVYYHKKKKKFISSISIGENGKILHIGTFDNPYIAHLSWASEKLRLARILVKEETKLVREAILDRYINIYENAHREYEVFLSEKLL